MNRAIPATPADDPTRLRWNDDGSYTPVCPLCVWEGKSRAVHADATNAVRAHMRGKRHAMRVRLTKHRCPVCGVTLRPVGIRDRFACVCTGDDRVEDEDRIAVDAYLTSTDPEATLSC